MRRLIYVHVDVRYREEETYTSKDEKDVEKRDM